jgi:hypothetical protein
LSANDEEVEGRYDAGNPLSVKEKEKRAKIVAEKRLNGLKQIMASADGRAWMWEFLGGCGLFAVKFTGRATQDAFFDGMRNAGMPVFAEIQRHCMNEYLLMVKESNS